MIHARPAHRTSRILLVASATLLASCGSESALGVSTSAAIAPSSATVVVGGTQQFVAVVPVKDTAQGVTWSTGDASIATVNASGLVTGVKIGSTTVSFKVNAEPALGAAAVVRVLAP